MKQTAVFLDRDGTINYDPGYISSPSELYVFPAARKGLKLLQEKGFLLFVVTNQSGVGRGFFTQRDLEAVHQKLEDELKEDGIYLKGIAVCPHHPDEGCDYRKPSPKLVYEIADKFEIDLKQSFFVGDKILDVLTGSNAGCQTILLATPEQLNQLKQEPDWQEPDYIAPDLYQAALLITRLTKNSSN